jgi:hypothetical protein
MHRLFAIAVLGAAAVLPPHLGAQFRGGMRFGGSGFRGQMVSSGPRVIVPSGSRRVFTTMPASGASFGFRRFDDRRFGSVAFGHNLRFRVFLNNSCFGCRRRFVSPAFFYPYLYSGYYPSTPQYAQQSYPSSPMVVVVQSPAPASYGQNDQLVQEVEALRAEVQQMREEQGGRQQTPSPPSQAKPAPRPSAQLEAPATVLVFRDGQRSEVQNYAITGKTLWVFNERQARKILLSDLDVPATQAANAEHGVEFSLPR